MSPAPATFPCVICEINAGPDSLYEGKCCDEVWTFL